MWQMVWQMVWQRVLAKRMSYLSSLQRSFRVLAVQPGFGGLNVPVSKLAPTEVVQQAASIAKVVPLMRS